jgi:hypothetical protein
MRNSVIEPRLQVGALALLFLSAILLAGCASVNWPRPHGGVYTEQLAADYRHTSLQETRSLDVLQQVQASCADLKSRRQGRYLVTRTGTVVANSGLSPDGLKSWFTLFAFDPKTLTAQRKYFVCVDELTTISPIGPRQCLFPPRCTLVFDSEMAMPSAPLGTDLQEASTVTTLRKVAARLREDVEHAAEGGNEQASDPTILSAGLLMNQVFRDALLELQRAPGLAPRLADDGVTFLQSSLDSGRVRMEVQDDRVITHVEVGLPATAARPTGKGLPAISSQLSTGEQASQPLSSPSSG